MVIAINSNVMALNAFRNLRTSQTSLSKAMEQLSSGLRINSARDDAAGLGISNRMTSQIRGINQAIRNANDGISLTLTAEGAMQESALILQRIRELAVQASNDTNNTTDRASLNKEVIQLKSELERIATTTEFNNKKLLDGSFSSALFFVGANSGSSQQIAVSVNSAKTEDLSRDDIYLDIGPSAVTGSNVTGNAITKNSIYLNGKDIGEVSSGSNIDIANAINAAAGSTIATVQNIQMLDFKTVVVNTGTTNWSVTASTTSNGSPAIAGIPEIQNIDFASITVAAGEHLNIAHGSGGSFQYIQYKNNTSSDLSGEALVDNIVTELGTASIGSLGNYVFTKHATVGTRLVITQASGNESNLFGTFYTINNNPGNNDSTGFTVQNGSSALPAIPESQIVDLTSSTLAVGDTITLTIDGEDISYVNNTSNPLTGSSLIATLATEFATSNVGSAGSYDFTPDSLGLKISQSNGNESDIVPISAVSQTNPSGTAVYSITIGGHSIDLSNTGSGIITSDTVAQAIDSLSDFSAQTNDSGHIEITYTATDNATFSLSETYTIGGVAQSTSEGFVDFGSTAEDLNGQLVLQSVTPNSLSGSGLSKIGLEEVGTVITTIDKLNVLTFDDAQSAIASVDKALQQIDANRGRLGAVQNRLESTISNLSNISENLTSARSRILDTDVAIASSTITKQTILQQAGISILSQANQIPQMVLSLIN